MNRLQYIVREFLDSLVVPVLEYLHRKVSGGLAQELARRAKTESADYVAAAMPTAMSFQRREHLWNHALAKRSLAGLVSEFGVWSGYSINHVAKRLNESVYGFDSFEGLKEDWSGTGMVQGAFSRGGVLPKVRPNVTLVKGWFDQTIPGFLAVHPEPFSYIHVDCDTYEGANALFEAAGSRIQKGTVIVFDEYFGYWGWKLGEYKAWQEFVKRSGIRYEYLGFAEFEVSLVVTHRP